MHGDVVKDPLSLLLSPKFSKKVISLTIETLSGVVASLRASGVTVGVVLVEEDVSTFTRTRRPCSKTS